MRTWMIVNGVVLAGFTAWLLQPSARESTAGPTVPPATNRHAVPKPTTDQVLKLTGVRFGIMAPQVPWSSSEITAIADSAGARPTLLQYFVRWTEELRPEALGVCYTNGALPIVSWEPWEGLGSGYSQPRFALRNIIAGHFDPYIRRSAEAIRDQGWPVAIRFAHEMNGNWYPWSESQSGNRPGQYVLAWRHVHDIFRQVGATNVIWLWSPNIIRPVPGVSLRALYPGDDYVDWVGVVGYAAREPTAAKVYQPTLTVLRHFTSKPVVITETGAPPGPGKAAWIRDFLAWLPKHPDVIGFVWSQFTADNGGNDDWRFTETPATTAAFRTGLASVPLAPPPIAPKSPST